MHMSLFHIGTRRLLALLLAFGFYAVLVGQSVVAQLQSSAVMTIQATVIEAPRITVDQALDFGTLVRGSAPVAVEPVSEQAGRFAIAGSAGTAISVQYSMPEFLTHENGYALPIDTAFFGSTEDISHQPARLSSGDQVSLNADGNYYLYLGGNVHVQDQAPGVYSGVFVLSITYN